MEVTHGLFSHMVLQRDANNVSQARIQGTAAASGKVYARVSKGGKPVKPFSKEGAAVGKAADGKFEAKLSGIPAGGPYDIELWIDKASEKLKAADVCVGDVWILAGQSNMQGIGWMKWAEKPDPLVRAFRMNDEWAVARDPLHDFAICVDPVHITLIGGVRPAPVKRPWAGVGPGLPFAKDMRRRTGVPQGLIAAAHGGTSMQQWDPLKKNLDGTSLYGATLRRFHKNGGSVAGIAWYQGESDANENDAKKYTQRMQDLIGNFRKDFKSPKLPFVTVQISRVANMGDAAGWNSIQDQQRKLPAVIDNTLTVPGIDLTLDDLIHIGGPDNSTLGRRIAEAMDFLRRGAKAGLPPIELKGIKASRNAISGAAEVIVEFTNVKGKLTSKDHPTGFALMDTNGDNAIFRVDLDGKKAILKTSLAETDAQTRAVHYGQGRNPFCNIRDEAGRSLPVFGPIPVGAAKAVTKYVNELQVSALQPSAGQLEGLNCPTDLAPLAFEPRKFIGPFCDRHTELGAQAPKDHLVYYRTAIDVAEPMDLVMNLGYDGPVKVWIDGVEQFFDPKGTNPAKPDDAKIRFKPAAGRHEVIVALGSNEGRAWGIFLHYERKDVTKKQLEIGSHAYEMPKILMA